MSSPSCQLCNFTNAARSTIHIFTLLSGIPLFIVWKEIIRHRYEVTYCKEIQLVCGKERDKDRKKKDTRTEVNKAFNKNEKKKEKRLKTMRGTGKRKKNSPGLNLVFSKTVCVSGFSHWTCEEHLRA
jgi:hypothetical protein